MTKQNFSVNVREFLSGFSVESQNVFKKFQEVLRMFSRGFRRFLGDSLEVLWRFSVGSQDILRRFSGGSQGLSEGYI